MGQKRRPSRRTPGWFPLLVLVTIAGSLAEKRAWIRHFHTDPSMNTKEEKKLTGRMACI